MPLYAANKRKHLILALLFVFLFWLVTVQIKNGRLPILERPYLALSGFVERVVVWPFNTASAIGRRYLFLAGVERENEQLRKEVNELRIENGMADELLRENNRLREALQFQQQTPGSWLVAQIIGKDISPLSDTVTINRGTNDGIRKDLAVISPAGVVGRVAAASATSAKVVLLTDPDCTLAVMVRRNREEGLLEGNFVDCAVKYVSYYADIQQGDLLVTSGMDGIFPKGIAVATVTKVVKREASSFQTVRAAPTVPLSRLEWAMVLKP